MAGYKSTAIPIGTRFGKLVVISQENCYPPLEGRKTNRLKYVCRCDCGKETEVFKGSLISSNTRSCGCGLIEARKRKTRPAGYTGERNVIRGIEVDAAKRGHAFELTEVQVSHLIRQNCHYCGQPPSQIRTGGGGVRDTHAHFVYTGIDRKDNSKGYLEDNCVPCCKVCNHAKKTMTVEQFQLWLSRAYHHTHAETHQDGAGI